MATHVMPRERSDQLQILHALSLEFSSANERFDRITRLTRRIFDVQTAFVWVLSNDRQWFRTSNGLDTTAVPYDISFCGSAILRKQTFTVRDARTDPELRSHPLVTGPPYIRFFAMEPILVEEEEIGMLCILDDRPRELSAQDLETLQNLAVLAAVECAVVALCEGQERDAGKRQEDHRHILVDPQTRCWNAMALQRMMTREIALTETSDTSFAYLHLQLLPDPFTIRGLSSSHADAIIIDVAGFLKRSIRPYDLVARIGDSRFAIFAPVCTPDVSDLLVDRIRSRVASSSCVVDGVTRTFDLSFGVVSGRPHVSIAPELLQRAADVALEEAIRLRRIQTRTTL